MPFLLINKPPNWTSHDVVAKLRSITGERKIGHAGTLDPFATGLLVVGVEREATRRLDMFKSWEKEYEVTMRFGATTDTFDREGMITPHPGVRAVERLELESALHKFRGSIEQIPPMYSAKKVFGKKLYEFARAGEEVERTPQRVMIYACDILESTPLEARLKVVCSPGTYIRTLAHDIGQELGVGAYAHELVRTRIGHLRLSEAHEISDIRFESWREHAITI